MKKESFRCDCPFTSALDILGDKWALVIIKQILFEEKQTFKEFLESDEGIATNILSERLKVLEKYQIITKGKLPDNKKMNIYTLTDKGLGLTPILVELALWSDKHMREFHPNIISDSRLDFMKKHKNEVIQMVQDNYRSKADTKEA